MDNAEFVELLFTNVLPGNTDAAGRAAFTAALDAETLTRAEMVAEFVDVKLQSKKQSSDADML